MSDGSIKIDILVDDKPIKAASKGLDKLEDSGHKAGKGVKSTEDSLKGTGKESEKAGSKIKKFATALGLVAIGAAAFKALKSSMDTAIARFDTLNKFPKVLQALGVSAEDSQKAMDKLSDGIEGLPTTLNEIASTAQRMYTSFNDMDKATDTALALNNALLGSGSSAADAQRGTEQYLQALQRGKFEMEEWKTLQETMDIGLIKVAESFGYAGKTAKQDLYNALKDNTITMEQFNDKLIEVGTGTGIMAKLAKENSLGIATSLSNLKNAAAKGIANIIDSFNKLSKEVTGKEIAQNIDGMKKVVNASFKAIQSVIESSAPIVKVFASAVQASIPIVKALSPALIGLASAYAIHKVINMVTTAIKANTTMMGIATGAKNAYAIATNRLSIALTYAVVQQKLQTAALLAYNKIAGLAVTVQAMLTSGLSLASIATIALSGAINILGVAIKVLLGPVGWVTLAIGALVGAVVGLIKWLNKESAEVKKLNAETDKLSESTEELNNAIKDSSENYKKTQNELKASAKANGDYARKIDELIKKENKSAAEKALLQSYIESLNGSVEGLNLAYDEEANSLNMSSKELQARLDLMKETEAKMAAQERITQIIEEQNQAQMKLDEINEKRAEWNQKVDEGTVSAGKAEKKISELNEKEAELNETLALLAEQYGITEEQIIAATENAARAVEEGNLRQITSYKELEGEQKETFDSMRGTYDDLHDAATNAFDKIETKTEHTMESMTETMRHNQKAVSEWAENQAQLLEWAGENGYDKFIPYIENMGIDSAAELALMARASEDELIEFADVVENGGYEAAEGLKTALGKELDEAVDVMVNFVNQGSKTMREQIKSSKFDEIGSMIPEGAVTGVEEGTPNLEKATEKMADKAVLSTKKKLRINSPSKVYKEIGGQVTDGMVLGISNGTAKVISTMRTLAMSMLTPYKDTKSKFKSIGSDAMAGLDIGLLAGKSKVMSTARSIANEVASTMQSALKIHSPSRVTEEIGEFVGKGLVVGINSMEKFIMQASKSMAKAAIPEPTWLRSASPRVRSTEKTKRNADKIMELFYKFSEVQV